MIDDKISIDFTIKEANIICKAIASNNPPKDEEMISYMLHARIQYKIAETMKKLGQI